MNIVLVEPEIHWNTGNIGRTCVATGTELHLVGHLGFSIEDREIRRAGLDYWVKLKLHRHKNFDAFLESIKPDASLLFFSTKAKRVFWDAPYQGDSYLVFGSETKGLTQDIHHRFGPKMYQIPIGPDVRSLNLSTAAGIVLYEALRQLKDSRMAGQVL